MCSSYLISTKTLVVVDYAQAYLGPLGHWMEQLDQRDHLVPVRLLLLERDGESLDESSWGSGLKAEVGRVALIRRSCWRELFLQLSPLHDEALLRIMKDYADTAGKSLPEAQAQQLVETLKITDPELRTHCTPCFSLMHGSMEKSQRSGDRRRYWTMY